MNVPVDEATAPSHNIHDDSMSVCIFKLSSILVHFHLTEKQWVTLPQIGSATQ